MAQRHQLQREWEALAPAWIREAREGRNPTRHGLLDQPMLEACGNVEGLSVLDSGCGEGRFCRILASLGVRSVLGLDLCEPMIEAARALQTERDTYRVADVQDLGFLADETFDIAISYLNQCDLDNFEANTKEVYRVLRRGGRFIIANLHPMRSAAGSWQKAPDGIKQHVILDNYFNERERHWVMMGRPLTNFHRSLSTYIQSFLTAGFTLTALIEPTALPEQLATYPELVDELRVPTFVIYSLWKPS